MKNFDTESWFKHHYFNTFQNSLLFKEMQNIFENSPWHREKNILIHTNMVVDEYIKQNDDILELYPNVWLNGALACAFHDVGKPSSIEQKQSEERGNYVSFPGHELTSARLWEDYAFQNWNMFENVLTAKDIHVISWLIEHHLPYKVKHQDKLNNLYITNRLEAGYILSNIIRADSYGRISDDHDTKKKDVENWIYSFENNQSQNEFYRDFLYRRSLISGSILYVLIGASGCGKSTFCKEKNIENYFSLDKLRLDWYDQDYSKAWQMSCDDSKFISKSQKEFRRMVETSNDIVVDNTNLTTKRRRFYIDEAKKNNYIIVAVTFPISLEHVMLRNEFRTDKNVPKTAIYQQYMNLQQPSLGEFDEIIVESSNFDK